MTTYPTLRLGVLQGMAALKAALVGDPEYLRRPACPYDTDTVMMLEELFKPTLVEVKVEVPVAAAPERQKVGRKKKAGELTDDDASEIEIEAGQLLKELREMRKVGAGEIDKMDTATKLTIIKAQAQLMEKLVTTRERFVNVRKISQFQSTVIAILDELVAEDMREEFLKRLEPYRS